MWKGVCTPFCLHSADFPAYRTFLNKEKSHKQVLLWLLCLTAHPQRTSCIITDSSPFVNTKFEIFQILLICNSIWMGTLFDLLCGRQAQRQVRSRPRPSWLRCRLHAGEKSNFQRQWNTGFFVGAGKGRGVQTCPMEIGEDFHPFLQLFFVNRAARRFSEKKKDRLRGEDNLLRACIFPTISR